MEKERDGTILNTSMLRAQYLGCIGLLADCAVQVDEETRERIEQAMVDAESMGLIKWKRILNRIDVEVA